MTFGEALKELRIEKNITQNQLAKLTGLSRVSIGNYERGDRDPNSDSIKKIATALDTSIDYLLGKSESKNDWGNLDKKVNLNELRKQIENFESLDPESDEYQSAMYINQLIERHAIELEKESTVINLNKALNGKVQFTLGGEPLSKKERAALTAFVHAMEALREIE